MMSKPALGSQPRKDSGHGYKSRGMGSSPGADKQIRVHIHNEWAGSANIVVPIPKALQIAKSKSTSSLPPSFLSPDRAWGRFGGSKGRPKTSGVFTSGAAGLARDARNYEIRSHSNIGKSKRERDLRKRKEIARNSKVQREREWIETHPVEHDLPLFLGPSTHSASPTQN